MRRRSAGAALSRVPRGACRVTVAVVLAACSLSDADRARVRAEVDSTLRAAYDLSAPNVEQRMLSLYGSGDPVVSASAGRVTTSRDSLAESIRYFWRSVGVNMREPRWVWDSMHVDVLSATHAVVTASYRIPHRNPRNQPHELGGAMTAVFVKRDGRWVIVQEHLSDRPQQP